MPSRACHHPTCCTYVTPPARYCPTHAQSVVAASRERHRFYDQHQRNATAKAFYNSTRWLAARAGQLARQPVCEMPDCGQFANTVHHRKRLDQCTPAEQIDPAFVKSLCGPCHSKLEAQLAKAST